MDRRRAVRFRSDLSAAIAFLALTLAQAGAAEPSPARDLLSPEEWRRLDAAVDRGLEYLSTRQRQDGSFDAPHPGQPAITSLCVLAFLSRGHIPSEGKYGESLDRAIDYVLQTQKADGLLFPISIHGGRALNNPHKAGAYNHAIAGVMLGEVYGMARGERSEAIAEAIRRALAFSLARQRLAKQNPDDTGGWRYLDAAGGAQSDLSVTAWEVMFFRSTRNAEFEVPVESMASAMEYVRHTYVPDTGTFAYGTGGMRKQQTRAMAGSGVLLLSLGGEHNTEMARTAGRWILDHPFDQYQRVIYGAEHYHYGAYYCSQAMFQLGGEYWERFFPGFMRLHVNAQQRDGSWPTEINRDYEYGNVYTTAMMILSLTPAYQLLPIYQR